MTTNQDDKNVRKNDVRQEPERDVRQQLIRDLEQRHALKDRRSSLEDEDLLAVDPAEIPDGFVVEWKRYQTYGQEDTQWLNALSRNGWEPADPRMFPKLVGKFHSGKFIFGGQHNSLILMIRAKELQLQAKHEEKQKADRQVRTKLEELEMVKGSDEAPRQDSTGKSLVKVKRSYEQMPVE